MARGWLFLAAAMFGACRAGPRDGLPSTPPPTPPPQQRGSEASTKVDGASLGERFVGAQRNLSLTRKVLPIAFRFRDVQVRMRGVHKRLRARDPEEYYRVRDATWDEIHDREASRIARIGRDMGGIYNKAWQFFATQDLLLPAPWVAAMQFSFEGFPARPWAEMEAAVAAALVGRRAAAGAPADAVGLRRHFASVDTRALASASIGQVHAAQLYSGADVVIKIIYPEIRQHMRGDLANIAQVADLVFGMIDMPIRETIMTILGEFVVSFPKEMDFGNELANTERARAAIAAEGLASVVAVPRCFPELSDASVLVMERLDGATVASLAGAKGGDDADGRAAASVLEVVDFLGRAIFRDGWFHADAHPGNVMVLRDGRAGLIDFGQCCSLTDAQRKRLCGFLMVLRVRSSALLKVLFADVPHLLGGDFEFKFNTSDSDEIGAILHYFFDTDSTGGGTVDAATFEAIRRTARYKPQALPIATNCPSEVVFFGRVVASLRKCFEKVGLSTFSVVEAWYGVARASLAAQRESEAEADRVSDVLLAALPGDPAHFDLQRSLVAAFLDVPDRAKAARVDDHRPLVAAACAAPDAARKAAALVLLRPRDCARAAALAAFCGLFTAVSLAWSLARWIFGS